MIIGACGYAGTGSSAISDLLKEYATTWVYDQNEFVIVHNPDGIEDLEFQLFEHFTKYTSSTVAIERFIRAAYFILNTNISSKKTIDKNEKIIEQFIDSITDVSWLGCGYVDNQLFANNHYKNKYLHMTSSKIRIKLNRLGLVKINQEKAIMPIHKMRLSVRPDDFMNKCARLIKEILMNVNADFTKKIVLDQPFPGNDPERSFKYFNDDCRAIVVDRDPRDLFVFFNYAVKNKNWVLLQFEPIKDVKKFCVYYRKLRENNCGSESTDKTLRINLADLIYEYDKTKTAIEIFCDLRPEDHTDKLKYFNPEISLNNLQIYKRFPEFKEDISYIEGELREYLYPYENYSDYYSNGTIMINKTE